MYKEDFEKERSDRARTAGKLESLERHAISHAQNLAENFQKELSESEAMTHSLEVQLRKANEDIKTKIAQVKVYRQQVEYLQQNLKEAEKTKQQQRPLQQEEMVNKVYIHKVELYLTLCMHVYIIICMVKIILYVSINNRCKTFK